VPNGNVRVTVGGTRQEGAIAEQLESGDDFFIKAGTPNIVFASAPASGVAIDVSFSYEVPILVEAQATGAKIPPSEREISETIKREFIRDFEDARQYAREYVNQRARLTGQVDLTAKYVPAPKQGRLCTVKDPSRDINGSFVVETRSIGFDGEMKLEVGDPEFNMIDWRHRVQRRVKDLEKRKTTDRALTKYRILDQNIGVSLNTSLTVQKRNINDSFIIGNQDNAVLGTDKLGDRRGSKTTVIDI